MLCPEKSRLATGLRKIVSNLRKVNQGVKLALSSGGCWEVWTAGRIYWSVMLRGYVRMWQIKCRRERRKQKNSINVRRRQADEEEEGVELIIKRS
jgi:hypothetical protein